MCRVLDVSTSGYYAWIKRTPSKRAIEDEELTDKIVAIHKDSYETYGAPRILAELKDDHGISCGIKRVGRLMRLKGIQGCHRRRARKGFTRKNPHAVPAADLVNRNFKADRPDQLYVADITYVPTLLGFIYLAVVIDCFTRMVVGWSIRNDLTDRLAIDALLMATHKRGRVIGTVHHSDHGSQYTSIDFGRTLKDSGILASMGSVGDCFDNALAESFFATLEMEWLDRHRFANKTEAKAALFWFIEGFYNRRRRHSKIGDLSPANFEKRYWESNGAA